MSDKRYEVIWRAKWATDGAKTPAEAANMLRERAVFLDAMAAAGVTFTKPVEDDYGFLTTNDPKVAERLAMPEADDEDDDA